MAVIWCFITSGCLLPLQYVQKYGRTYLELFPLFAETLDYQTWYRFSPFPFDRTRGLCHYNLRAPCQQLVLQYQHKGQSKRIEITKKLIWN